MKPSLLFRSGRPAVRGQEGKPEREIQTISARVRPPWTKSNDHRHVLGAGNPRYSSTTQRSLTKKQAKEEKAACPHHHRKEQKYRRQERGVCNEYSARLHLVKDFFIQKEELTRQLASGSRELNSCLPTQPSKAEKHKQTHGVSAAVRMISGPDSSALGTFVNNIAELFPVQAVRHLGRSGPLLASKWWFAALLSNNASGAPFCQIYLEDKFSFGI